MIPENLKLILVLVILIIITIIILIIPRFFIKSRNVNFKNYTVEITEHKTEIKSKSVKKENGKRYYYIFVRDANNKSITFEISFIKNIFYKKGDLIKYKEIIYINKDNDKIQETVYQLIRKTRA